ncbi:hypothetical protein MMC12_000068 [Toensbergia leucococca]|nr:hypothetical protein [Toensbergia leucococca]
MASSVASQLPSQSTSSEITTNAPDSPDTSSSRVIIQDNSVDHQQLAKANLASFQYNASLHPVDTAFSQGLPSIVHHSHSPLSASLRVQTDLLIQEMAVERSLRQVSSTTTFPVRSASVKSALSATQRTTGSLSPGSALSSPNLGLCVDMSPLPSPITIGESSELWPRTTDTTESEVSAPDSQAVYTPNGSYSEPIAFVRGSPKKRKGLLGIVSDGNGTQGYEQQISEMNASNYARNRSISEYVPDLSQLSRPRNIAVSGSGAPPSTKPLAAPNQHLHREQYLAIQRGLTASTPRPPTPPRSNQSGADSTSSELESPPLSPPVLKEILPLRYEAHLVQGGGLRKWRAVRQLGKGTFSTVMLATTDGLESKSSTDQSSDDLSISNNEENLDPKTLVAVKICEHGPAGGADEKKVESSLKRELEILKSIHHPCLVHLKAVNVLNQRAFLVLNYCPGGDLFELASFKLHVLVPSLIRRIFAELVAAVRYLHLQYIVHRDIKLENVLVNIPSSVLATIPNFQTYPYPIVTLTDLGLGRWIPKPPDSPLLDTRCGSEDYAAPELLMGQEYDGRATDAWALGVLLYSLMEGKLPFDPTPGRRRQSPTSHRIARCEWNWVKWADEEGEWDVSKESELEGGREIVEGLLTRSRSRWGLEKVEARPWVSGGVEVEGPLRRSEDEM